jgi:putative transposase
LPLISPQIETQLYSGINAKCKELKREPLAIGGIEDHLHLLVRFPTTLAVASLVKEVKGASSYLTTHEIAPTEFFKWQGAYGAFTVSKEVVPKVREYVLDQKKHHAMKSVFEAWEKCETEVEVG